MALAFLGAAPLEAQDAGGPSSGARLNPGDMVRLIVWRNTEMSGEFEVAPDSTLGHPILREVKVAGVPIQVAEERLRVILGRFETNPYLVLLPRYRVLVGGEVGSPGVHTLSPNVSVAEAVLLAGGPTQRGRMNRVRLVRGGQEQMLDLTDLDSRPARQLIQSGDQIVVERRASIVRDYVRPILTVTGSVAAILNLISRF